MEHSRILQLGLVSRIVVWAILIALTIVMVLPFLWMISTSFKPPTEVIAWPPNMIPANPTLDNYAKLRTAAPFARFFLNSIIMSTLSTVGIILTSTLAGYIFSKYRFPGRNVLFGIILLTAMVPLEVYILPLFITMVDLKWLNTYQGMVAPYLIMSFGIFFMRQNIGHSIPDELLEAARMDGASDWRVFATMVLPLSKSAIGALAILAFMQAWAAFIWPLLITRRTAMYNMELGLGFFQNAFTIDFGPISAASVISFMPVLLVYFIFRKQIQRGVTLGAVKG
jgi:multiple sugar transport system permease protein